MNPNNMSVIRLIICAFFIVFTITFINAQQVAPVTTAGNISGCSGSPCIAIPVTVTGFTKIKAISLRMEFDATNMTFCSYANINPLLSGLIYGTPALVSGSTYRLMASWVDMVPRTLAAGEKLFDVKFNLVSGNGALSFNNSSSGGNDCEYADSLGNPLPDLPSSSFYHDATVTVHPFPIPVITGTTNLCINSGFYNYTTEAGMTNYVWTVSAGGTIVSGNGTNQIQVIWNSSGAQTVCAGYTDTFGCSPTAPSCLNVSVNSMPASAGYISGTPDLCAGTKGVFYMVDPVQNAIIYIWALPPGASIASGANTNSISVNFAANATSGDMVVFGNNICGNGTGSPPFAVTVDPVPPTPVISASGNILTSNIAIGNQWYINGTLIPGANDPTYVATATGTYSTIVTWNTCSSDSSNNLYVNVVGNHGLQNNDWIMYPNPNDGCFMLSIGNLKPDHYTLYLYNTMGMIVYEQKDLPIDMTTQIKIRLGTVADGVYSIVLKGNGRILQKKVIIRK